MEAGAGSLPRPAGLAALGGWTVRALAEAALFERARWALWLPVALGVGIGCYFLLPVEPPGWSKWAAMLCCAGLWFVAARTQRVGLLIVLSLVSAMALGFGVAKLRADAVAAPHLMRDVGPVRMEGRIVSAQTRGTGMRVVIAVTSLPRVAANEMPERVRVTFRQPNEILKPGRSIGLTALLMPPPAPAAPGDYDFGRWAYFQGIGAVGYALGGPRALDQAPQPGFFDRLSARVESFRTSMTAHIRAVVPGSSGGIAAAMITGDRGGIDEADTEAFRDSGLAHVLSISGLHLALAGGFFFWSVRAILALFPSIALRYPIKKWAAVAALAGAGCYLLISGGGPPAVRSYIMLAIMFLAVLFDRPALNMRAVALAAAILLLFTPESLMDPGFQMSFAAVICLVAIGEWEITHRPEVAGEKRGWLAWAWRRICAVTIASMAAGLATAPFAIYHFDRAAQFGALANLAAMPIVGFIIMPAATAAMVLMPLGWDGWALKLMGWGIDQMMAVAHWVSSLPGAASVVAVWPDAVLLMAIAGGLWLTLWERGWRWLGLAPIAFALILAQRSARPDVFVGEDGTSVAVRTQDGRLSFLRPTADEYAASTWLLRDGDPRLPADAIGGEGIRCDGYACVAQTLTGMMVASVVRAEALQEDCARADIVISAVPVRIRCDAQIVIDRFALSREGAHSISFGETPVVRTTEGARGQRPWSMRPVSTAE